MKVCWSLLFLWAAAAVAVQGQAPASTAHATSVSGANAPISVGYQKTVDLSVAGATAAYSLDSTIVEASATNGLVEIIGKGPGSASIVVVTAAGVQTLAVTVPVPPPILPPGFEPPENRNAAEVGTYEFRYNSDPNQITNSLELKRTQGESFTRMQVVNANLFSSNSSASTVGFPFLAYEIGRPNTDITFLDKSVINSPLTLDNYLVRGFHLRHGPWEFHGGFTSVAMFQGLFLSTEREYTAGISRLFRIDHANSLEANAYYFQNPASQLSVATNGAVGSLVYRLKLTDKGNFLAEIGASHGVGFAARGSYDDQRNHIIGDLRIQSRNFASLAVNNQHGTFADLSASRKLNDKFYASLDLNQSDFNLPTLRQSTFTTSALLNYRLNRNFTLSGGGAFATFQSQIPLGSRISTINLPAGIDYSTRHFGTGFQYQRTVNIEGGGGGNDYAVNARGSMGNFQLSGFFRHDVQVPTLAAIFSQIPGLQDALDRAGIVATSPEQLADLLRNTALLQLLGFTNVFAVNLAPARNDTSATMSWISRNQGRRKVDVTFFHSNTELLQGNNFILTTATVSYGQRLGANTNIVGSAALVRTTNLGTVDTHPIFSVSLQRKFYSVPSLLLPGRHGMIEGHVFRDDDSTGIYNPQSPPLAGVEVRLDDERTTHSDASGFYSFHHVPFGVHRVEAHLQSDEPFFYTTDSPATTDMNASVDFGVNFAKGQVFGFVLDDSGSGIGGITVELKSEKVTRRMTTGGTGKFAFTGLPPADYSVATLPDSFPPGYSLQDLSSQKVTVEPGKPASTQFTVRALRSIAGRVLVYDKSKLQTVPLEGAIVRLKERSLEVKTGASGGYIFRNLPAGTFTVSTEYEGKEITRTVVLTPAPINLRDIDLNVGAKEASVKPAGVLNENAAVALNDAHLMPESGIQPRPESDEQPTAGIEANPAASTVVHPPANKEVKPAPGAAQPIVGNKKVEPLCPPTLQVVNPKRAKVRKPSVRNVHVAAAAKTNQHRKPVTAGAKTNSQHKAVSTTLAKTSQGPRPAVMPVHNAGPVNNASPVKHVAAAQAHQQPPGKIKASSVSASAARKPLSHRLPAHAAHPSQPADTIHCLPAPQQNSRR
ncbi:MAG TPA: carboxypeptidase regulatory-like domain-containing protein [Candidatus Angelobacter sp.]|nr:carboxypeptidase regulatory-like domain-containing protein [Candidatus Angelobacter sp.]